MEIGEALQKLSKKQDLEYSEVETVMDSIMKGECSPVMTSAYLTALSMKGETVDEIAASAYQMRAHATPLPGDHSGDLEIVGTGGDRSGSFNISTTSAFVIASCDVKVAKHGNRAASSKCGAADVLEALGAVLDNEPEITAEIQKECGFCFMFAQKYHTSMKYIAPIRRELGIRTIFNILGPLTNPAKAGNQLCGVYSDDMTQLMTEVLNKIGVKRAMTVHGMDGLDEISACDKTSVCENFGNGIRKYTIEPEDFGMNRGKFSELVGGDPAENADITRSILSGEKGTRRNAVLLNSGAGLYTAGKCSSIQEGIEMAVNAIDSGDAKNCMEKYVRLTRESR